MSLGGMRTLANLTASGGRCARNASATLQRRVALLNCPDRSLSWLHHTQMEHMTRVVLGPLGHTQTATTGSWQAAPGATSTCTRLVLFPCNSNKAGRAHLEPHAVGALEKLAHNLAAAAVTHQLARLQHLRVARRTNSRWGSRGAQHGLWRPVGAFEQPHSRVPRRDMSCQATCRRGWRGVGNALGGERSVRRAPHPWWLGHFPSKRMDKGLNNGICIAEELHVKTCNPTRPQEVLVATGQNNHISDASPLANTPAAVTLGDGRFQGHMLLVDQHLGNVSAYKTTHPGHGGNLQTTTHQRVPEEGKHEHHLTARQLPTVQQPMYVYTTEEMPTHTHAS